MAQKNRTEVKTEVTNEISSTVTVAKHTGMLNNSLVESAVFRKDVITTANGSGAQVIDFTNIDQHEFTITGASATFSFTNLNIGDRVKLVVIKTSAGTVGFTGTVAQNIGQTVGLTTISYEIYYDNSGIIVTQMNRSADGSIAIGAITAGGAQSVDAVNFFYYTINNNICTIWGEIDITVTTGSIGLLNFSIVASRVFGTLKQLFSGAGIGTGGAQLSCAIIGTSEVLIKGEIRDTGADYGFSFYKDSGGTFTGGPFRISFNGSVIIS